MKPGTNYNRRMVGHVDPYEVLRQAMRRQITAACRGGDHRPETDAETGNEVCRFCGTVVDDYSDVDAATVR